MRSRLAWKDGEVSAPVDPESAPPILPQPRPIVQSLAAGLAGLPTAGRIQAVWMAPPTPANPGFGRRRTGATVLLGADSKPFVNAHQNGYGMQVFGARGPIGEFAAALRHWRPARPPRARAGYG